MSSENDISAVAISNGILTISGKLTSSMLGKVETELSRHVLDQIELIDGSGVTAIDSAGAVLINSIIVRIARKNVRLLGFSDSATKLLSLSQPVEKKVQKAAEQSKRIDLEAFGSEAYGKIDRINEIVILVADIIYWSVVGIFDRNQYRKGSFTEQAFRMGSSALPIVCMILFLVGAISALQSTATLRSFGASIFVADMIAIGLAREMAPLMTAIIISGRSGSAIAAEIATMKFTEELDAIRTMGLNPIRFVVVPKLWAMVVCMPLLTIMALLFGIMGGFLIGITYIQLAPQTFINRIVVSLFFWDIVTGLIKSVSFALIITIVGTYRGLTFKGGADG